MRPCNRILLRSRICLTPSPPLPTSGNASRVPYLQHASRICLTPSSPLPHHALCGPNGPRRRVGRRVVPPPHPIAWAGAWPACSGRRVVPPPHPHSIPRAAPRRPTASSTRPASERKPWWSNLCDQTFMVKPRWSNIYGQTSVVKPLWSKLGGQTFVVEPRWSNLFGRTFVVKPRPRLHGFDYMRCTAMQHRLSHRRGPSRIPPVLAAVFFLLSPPRPAPLPLTPPPPPPPLPYPPPPHPLPIPPLVWWQMGAHEDPAFRSNLLTCLEQVHTHTHARTQTRARARARTHARTQTHTHTHGHARAHTPRLILVGGGGCHRWHLALV